MTDLLDIRRIYVEPAAAELPRGKEVLARFPDAERVEVDSHQRIPELFGGEKGRQVARLTGLIAERAPYCRVRYAF